jgi:hypothetical protein
MVRRKNKMAYSEITPSGDLKGFNYVGDYAEGYYKGMHEGLTAYGEAVFMDFTTENGDFSIIQTAGLKRYNWEDMEGLKVRIEYVGDNVNPKTKRTYKDYKVLVDKEDILV